MSGVQSGPRGAVTRVGSWRSRPPQETWILTATPPGSHTGGARQEKGCSAVSLKMVTPQGQERARPPSNRRTPGRPWGRAHTMQEPTLGTDSGRPQPRPPSQGLCTSYHLVRSPPTLDTQPLEPGIPTPHLGWHHPSRNGIPPPPPIQILPVFQALGCLPLPPGDSPLRVCTRVECLYQLEGRISQLEPIVQIPQTFMVSQS